MPKPTPDYEGIHAWAKARAAQEAAVSQADGGGRWSVFDTITFARDNSHECTCIVDCQDDPATACSLSGEWHVHPGEPCPVHPDAPGDR